MNLAQIKILTRLVDRSLSRFIKSKTAENDTIGAAIRRAQYDHASNEAELRTARQMQQRNKELL